MAATFKLDPTLINELKAIHVQTRVANEIIKVMKEFIAAGKSPVQGVGRFVGYKAAEATKAISQTKRSFNKISKAIPALKASSNSRNKILNSNIADIKRRGYPYSVLDKFPGKRVRPVNLELTGDMLRALIFKIEKKGPRIGIFEQSEALKAETHNDGTQVPKVPRRKFIPNKRGDELVISLMRTIKAIYSEELNAIIKRSNAK